MESQSLRSVVDEEIDVELQGREDDDVAVLTMENLQYIIICLSLIKI